MTTIEKILGNCPNKTEVDNEFDRRNLNLNGFNETIIEKDGLFHVHGHFSTRSESSEMASKKMLIIYDELTPDGVEIMTSISTENLTQAECYKVRVVELNKTNPDKSFLDKLESRITIFDTENNAQEPKVFTGVFGVPEPMQNCIAK